MVKERYTIERKELVKSDDAIITKRKFVEGHYIYHKYKVDIMTCKVSDGFIAYSNDMALYGKTKSRAISSMKNLLSILYKRFETIRGFNFVDLEIKDLS